MTTSLNAMLERATKRPWVADQFNWRNEPVAHDWYIHGNIHEPLDEESDDPEENTGSATSVAIVVGNATAGNIPESTARLIAIAVNHFEAMLEALRFSNDAWLGRPVDCRTSVDMHNAVAVVSEILDAIEAAAKESVNP